MASVSDIYYQLQQPGTQVTMTAPRTRGRLSSLASLLFASYATANLAYKSRPDLAPPVLNITIPATNDTAEGLIFYTPESTYADDTGNGPAQSGPYIFTEKGDLVWSGFGFVGPRSENFQVHTYRGEQVLSIFEGSHNSPMGHGHGHTSIFDNRYRLLDEIKGGGHTLADQHEFLFFDNHSAVFTVFNPEIADLSPYGATEESQSWILNNKIQKVDTDSNRMLWEWSALDHVDPAGTNITLQSGNAGLGVNSSQAWHYFYMNAFDVDADTNTYLISARSMMHAKYLNYETKGSKEIISFFDNSAHENLAGGPVLQTRAYSAGKVVELDTENWNARLIAEFRAPGDLSVRSQGNLQLLSNGNAFINWGYDGAMSEHKPDGTTIWFSRLDSGKLGPGSENYRAFKFEWHALPYEEPALVAFKESNGTSVYVSWNGDTETRVWKFFGVQNGQRELLGQVSRGGFETSWQTSKKPVEVVAEAYDAHGHRLVSSQVKTREYKPRLFYA
ncbi:uncharacterized protein N7483_006469 [Penicillium malachiteum]|uniref:uncharacterized protein n=1 Tax=Penicillium malachiteum TaxID=1324776 RepID=UPI0025479CBF|nr:uncharacterized protein N7483_006469 [Penicillium malachiteum]KAJ5725112.1 hypothetical protein N7483_006469 [Penicillium malachiteum]